MPANKTSFKPGHGGGRPKGTQNKVTQTVRETVLSAFNQLQKHPEYNLYEFAKKEPIEFYRIVAKLLFPGEKTINVETNKDFISKSVVDAARKNYFSLK